MLKSASPELNPVAPHASFTRIALPITEGSGTSLANKAPTWTSLGVGTLTNSAAWATDAEGPYLDLTAGYYATFAAVSGDKLFPDWAIQIRLWGSTLTATVRPFIAVGTNPSSAQGGLSLNRVANTSTLRATFRSGGTSHIVEWTNVDFAVKHTVILCGGAGGFRGWMDGTAGSANGGTPSTVYAPLRVPNGEQIWLGRNSASAQSCNANISVFNLWAGVDLEAFQRDKLLVDPFMVTREPPGKTAELAAATAWASGTKTAGQIVKPTASANNLFETVTGGSGGSEPTWLNVPSKTTTENAVTWFCRTPSFFSIDACVPVGEMTGTTAKFQACLSRWKQYAGAVYLHVKYATTLAGVDAASWNSASGTTAGTAIELTLTGLSSGTRYYYQVGWSTDGSTIYGFPNGAGTFVSQRLTAASHNVLVCPDSHINAGSAGITPNNIGGFLSIAYNDDGSVNSTYGTRSRMAQAKTIFECAKLTGSFDYFVFGGDQTNVDLDTTDVSSSATTTSDLFQRWRSWGDVMSDIITSAGGYYILGNHEGEYNPYQDYLNGMQKRCQITRLLHWPNPSGATYPESGESADTEAEWVKAASLCSTGSHLENYWAFTWGGWRHTMLDGGRYGITTQAYGGTGYADSPGEWKMGYGQKTWFEGVNRTAPPVGRVNWRHDKFGGDYAGRTSGTGLYKRGALTYLYSRPEVEDLWLADQFDRFNYTLDLFFHDHTVTHCQRSATHELCCGNMGVQSHTTANPVGLHFDELDNSHGTAVSNGALDPTGATMAWKGGIKRFNTIGFVLLEFSSTGVYTTVYQTCVQTSPTGGDETAIDKFSLQWNGTAAISWGERWLANATVAEDGNDRISLVDSLNASPVPTQVYGAYDDPVGTWYTGALTQFAASYGATAIVSNGTVTYTVGDCRTPSNPNGFLYRCTARTGACNAEPDHSTGATSFPVAIGGTVTVGNTTWECCEHIGLYPSFYGKRIDGTIQLKTGASAAVRPVYTPRIIYRPFIALNARRKVSAGAVEAFASANVTTAQAIAFMHGGIR